MKASDILVQNKADNSTEQAPESYVRVPKFVQDVTKMKMSALQQIKKDKNSNDCITFTQNEIIEL